MRSALPVFTSTGQYSTKDGITKNALFANIPLSDAECERGWKELACFEIGESRHCVVPSASVHVQAWKSIMQAANASSIDLTQPLSEQSISTIIDSENDWPIDLSHAILRSMTASATESGVLQLDDQTCARHIGQALLKDLTDTSKDPVSVVGFKKAWADLLPEKWRDLADLKTVEGSYKLENGSKDIVHAESLGGINANTNGVAPEEAKSTLGAKRKWHEKFRASKKPS